MNVPGTIERQEARDRELIRRARRRVAVGGALGALPGLAIALVPLVLHDLGLISGDQSQIGFIGLPVLIIGTLVGIAMAADESRCVGSALLGAGGGFVVGLVAGVLVGAVATGLAGIWLIFTPLGMIGGATIGTVLRLRRADGAPTR